MLGAAPGGVALVPCPIPGCSGVRGVLWGCRLMGPPLGPQMAVFRAPGISFSAQYRSGDSNNKTHAPDAVRQASYSLLDTIKGHWAGDCRLPVVPGPGLCDAIFSYLLIRRRSRWVLLAAPLLGPSDFATSYAAYRSICDSVLRRAMCVEQPEPSWLGDREGAASEGGCATSCAGFLSCSVVSFEASFETNMQRHNCICSAIDSCGDVMDVGCWPQHSPLFCRQHTFR